MRRSVGYTVLLFAIAGAATVQAQETRPRVIGPLEGVRVQAHSIPSGAIISRFSGPTVEAVLRRKEDLELTEQQLTQLEALRKEDVARRQDEARDIIDLESRAAVGLLERTALRAEIEKRDDTQRLAGRNLRDRLEQILTVEQRERMERFPFLRTEQLKLQSMLPALHGDLVRLRTEFDRKGSWW